MQYRTLISQPGTVRKLLERTRGIQSPANRSTIFNLTDLQCIFTQLGKRYADLLARDNNPDSAINQEAGDHAAEAAVARRIAAGDLTSWNSFRPGILPVITKSAIEWCHRIAPGARCGHCATSAESCCAHFSSAVDTIEAWIRLKALKAYEGQSGLTFFLQSLASSDWWFWDFTNTPTERLPPHNKARAEQGYHADLVQTWAVLSDSGSAWTVFLATFNGDIERAAIEWCHRPVPWRVCLKCKPHAYDADQSCDSFSDAYVYILNRLRSVALARYAGRTSLKSFVYLCLHDYRWWASFVQTERARSDCRRR